MRDRSIPAILLAAFGLTLCGCSSDGPPIPDLTPAWAANVIADKWAHEELNHFRVVFHSDTVVQCGVQNDLWKLSEIKDANGNTLTSKYQLTDRGKQILTDIDLKASGRGHEIVLKGPYRPEITAIVDGPQPNQKKVGFRWIIDWDRAPADLKACLPRFELAGNQGALFVINDPAQPWMLASLMNPEDVGAPAAGGGSVLDKLH
jgi:hypothetical protein